MEGLRGRQKTERNRAREGQNNTHAHTQFIGRRTLYRRSLWFRSHTGAYTDVPPCRVSRQRVQDDPPESLSTQTSSDSRRAWNSQWHQAHDWNALLKFVNHEKRLATICLLSDILWRSKPEIEPEVERTSWDELTLKELESSKGHLFIEIIYCISLNLFSVKLKCVFWSVMFSWKCVPCLESCTRQIFGGSTIFLVLLCVSLYCYYCYYFSHDHNDK